MNLENIETIFARFQNTTFRQQVVMSIWFAAVLTTNSYAMGKARPEPIHPEYEKLAKVFDKALEPTVKGLLGHWKLVAAAPIYAANEERHLSLNLDGVTTQWGQKPQLFFELDLFQGGALQVRHAGLNSERSFDRGPFPVTRNETTSSETLSACFIQKNYIGHKTLNGDGFHGYFWRISNLDRYDFECRYTKDLVKNHVLLICRKIYRFTANDSHFVDYDPMVVPFHLDRQVVEYLVYGRMIPTN